MGEAPARAGPAWYFATKADARSSWSAVRSCLRELMPSFAKTLRRCHSTVRALMNSWAPISGFDRPSLARRAIWASCAVRSSRVSTLRLRTVAPVARSSLRVRSANPSMDIALNISYAELNSSRASIRRFARRSHSPYSRCARASSPRTRVWLRCAIALRNKVSASSPLSRARERASIPRAQSVPVACALLASRFSASVARSVFPTRVADSISSAKPQFSAATCR